MYKFRYSNISDNNRHLVEQWQEALYSTGSEELKVVKLTYQISKLIEFEGMSFRNSKQSIKDISFNFM